MSSPHKCACLLLLVTALSAPAADNPPSEVKKDGPFPALRPDYTAFPDLKPTEFNETDLLPVLPSLPADASPLRKLLHAQAHEGLIYLALVGDRISHGSWMSHYLLDTILLSSAAYVVAAEGETLLADRIPWYEERVRALKGLELLLKRLAAFSSGTLPPQWVHLLRFHRLGAEAELLALKDEVAKPAPTPVIVIPVVVCPTPCPPVCVRPRGRLLPRLFHRR